MLCRCRLAVEILQNACICDVGRDDDDDDEAGARVPDAAGSWVRRSARGGVVAVHARTRGHIRSTGCRAPPIHTRSGTANGVCDDDEIEVVLEGDGARE